MNKKELDILDILPKEAIEAIDRLGYDFLKAQGYDTEGAAESVRGLVKFVHGENVEGVSDVFGLPYTSSGDFAAIWNTNAEARLKRTGKSASDGLFFRGVAIEKADGKPQAVTVWARIRDGKEVGAEYYTVKELKEEIKR